MSESILIDDLDLLSVGDLKAVFSQVPTEKIVVALWGCNAGLRTLLLSKLPGKYSDGIVREIDTSEHFSFDQVKKAQKQIVHLMCELSRSGVIAFDAPEDMVA